MMKKTFTLELTQDHLNVIAAGLQELPFKYASPLVAEINKQVSAQRLEIHSPEEEAGE
jgi:hypothetical protein